MKMRRYPQMRAHSAARRNFGIKTLRVLRRLYRLAASMIGEGHWRVALHTRAHCSSGLITCRKSRTRKIPEWRLHAATDATEFSFGRIEPAGLASDQKTSCTAWMRNKSISFIPAHPCLALGSFRAERSNAKITRNEFEQYFCVGH